MMDIQTGDVACLLDCSLLQGVSEAELPAMLTFLKAHTRSYRRGEVIFLIGDTVQYAGIVLEGTVALRFLDEGDNSVNMDHFSAGSVFGQSLACQHAISPMEMQAMSNCRILFVDLQGLLEGHYTDAQKIIVGNLLRSLTRQNVFLNQKIQIMSQHRLRDRIKVFLRQQERAPDGRIHIRFNRSDLAAFLGVNRSALSRELSAMQAEGILELGGQEIRLLEPDFL